MLSKKLRNFFSLSKVSSNDKTLLTFRKKIRENMLKCPRCNVNMEKLKKGNVVIDVCRKCGGMWLDKGEMEKLAKIAQKMRKGGKGDKK